MQHLPHSVTSLVDLHIKEDSYISINLSLSGLIQSLHWLSLIRNFIELLISYVLVKREQIPLLPSNIKPDSLQQCMHRNSTCGIQEHAYAHLLLLKKVHISMSPATPC